MTRSKNKRNNPLKVTPRTVSKIRRNKKEAYGSIKEWFGTTTRVKKRDGYKCRVCGETKNLQVDHIIPVSRGGRTIDRNLWTLCATCHSKRPGHRKAKSLIMSGTKP